MARSNKIGPIYLPWIPGHAKDEVMIFGLSGIIGAVVGATLLGHYRRLNGRGA